MDLVRIEYIYFFKVKYNVFGVTAAFQIIKLHIIFLSESSI